MALSRSASDHLVGPRQALFRRTWNCLHFDIVTFTAPYTRTSIAVWIVWIFCSRDWWDSIAKCSFTLAFADIDIFWSWQATFFFWNPFSASSSAVRDRSVWCCWLPSRENSHNAPFDPITISSEAVSTGVFRSSLQQSRIGVQFIASVLIMPWFSSPCQELHFVESSRLEKDWSAGYRGNDVYQLSNWSLTFLAFRYLSSQCNKFLTKLKSSWCNSSGCESW